MTIAPSTDLLIVVPARGGSKGLPGKNSRPLGGRPLIAWTAEAIRRAGIEEACSILTTDDHQIADAGRAAGLTVPFMRPAPLAADDARMEGVIEHALNWYRDDRKGDPKAIMLLQPTSPFRSLEAIRTSLTWLDRPEVDSVIGVRPIYRSLATLFQADAEMQLTPLEAEKIPETQRQAVRPFYTPNGALYIIRASAFRASKTFFPPRTFGIAMNAIESLDIDDETDWALAEAVFEKGLSWAHRA